MRKSIAATAATGIFAFEDDDDDEETALCLLRGESAMCFGLMLAISKPEITYKKYN